MENKFQTVIKNIASRTPPKKTAQIFFQQQTCKMPHFWQWLIAQMDSHLVITGRPWKATQMGNPCWRTSGPGCGAATWAAWYGLASSWAWSLSWPWLPSSWPWSPWWPCPMACWSWKPSWPGPSWSSSPSWSLAWQHNNGQKLFELGAKLGKLKWLIMQKSFKATGAGSVQKTKLMELASWNHNLKAHEAFLPELQLGNKAFKAHGAANGKQL